MAAAYSAISLLGMLANLVYLTSAQPSYVYDNSYGAVNISGSENDGTRVYNWTVKYPLGFLCEDSNWKKTLYIDITAKTAQADLVLGFGTNTEYFALAIPYDGGMRIPLKVADANGDYTIGTASNDAAYSGFSMAPPPNSNLFTATTTFEQQYTTDTDFRRSLIPGGDAWEWYHIINKTSPYYQGAFPSNGQQLIIEIFGDRVLDITQLMVSKNNVNFTVRLTSTWPLRVSESIYLFFGMDAAIGQQEIFELSQILSVDECTSVTIPTAPTTAQPTNTPSVSPTVSPTEVTSAPSGTPTNAPSQAPTINTADCDWNCYIANYADLSGYTVSAAEQHYIDTGYGEGRNCQCVPSNAPTGMPSAAPSLFPTTSAPSNVATTALPSVSPVYVSVAPTMTPSVSPVRVTETTDDQDTDENEDTDADNDNLQGSDATLIQGVDNLFVYIGGGVLLFIILLVIGIVIFFKLKNRTLRDHAYMSDDW